MHDTRDARSSRGLPLLLLITVALASCSSSDDGEPAVPDTTAPTVTLASPGATVSRTVTLQATANDDVGVAEVRFLADGTQLGADTTAPFTFAWDTSGLGDGIHTLRADASDAAGNATQSATVDVTIDNLQDFAVALDGALEVPATDTAAGGTATMAINVGTGAVTGELTLTGMTVTAAHIHDGHAGSNGPVVIGLTQSPTNPAVFSVPANAVLTAAQVDDLLTGGLYLNAHSSAFPDGQVRGQILPPGFVIIPVALNGREEVPRVDEASSGTAAITIETATRRAFAHLTLVGLDDAAAAHVHRAVAGTNGDVIVGLAQDTAAAAHWFADGVTLSQGDYDAALRGELYFNAHSAAHPDGEVRGQIVPEGIDLLVGELSGVQEVPEQATSASGTFALTVTTASRAFVLHANVTGADDGTAAHIHHEGFAGVNGSVAIELTKDAADPGHWSATGTFDPGLYAELLAGATYVNVHTPANQGGEIRGQIVPDGIHVLFPQLTGAEEVPANGSPATARAAVTVNTESGAVVVHVRTTGADDAIAAHVHRGFAGENGGVQLGLAPDANDPAHWSAEDSLTAEQVADFLAGRQYLNVHTPANQDGEIRAQLAPPGIEVLFTAMSGGEVVPPVTTTATGLAATTANLRTRSFVAHVNTSGLAGATSGSINEGAAGANGAAITQLAQDPANDAHWSSSVVLLGAGQFTAYQRGATYATIASATHADGEIRGQIVPPSAPPPDATAPTVSITAPAASATVTGMVTVTANAADDVGVSVVRFFVGDTSLGSDTTAPYSVSWDTTATANGAANLTAEAEDEAGNVGTSAPVAVTVSNASGVTLSQIQVQVFTPTCAVSGCHTGPTSSTLPSGMNLSSAAASYAALVGVTSLNEPPLLRVEAGDPDNSYLIRKLEGTQTVGVRMPFGGAPLSQSTINQIRAWIADGAPPAMPGEPGY